MEIDTTLKRIILKLIEFDWDLGYEEWEKLRLESFIELTNYINLTTETLKFKGE
jgi:hypothetical protein